MKIKIRYWMHFDVDQTFKEIFPNKFQYSFKRTLFATRNPDQIDEQASPNNDTNELYQSSTQQDRQTKYQCDE